MWKPLVDLVIGIALAFYKEWQARKDVKTIERQALALDAAHLAAKALAFKARADADAAKLRDRGGTIELPSDDAGPGSPAR